MLGIYTFRWTAKEARPILIRHNSLVFLTPELFNTDPLSIARNFMKIKKISISLVLCFYALTYLAVSATAASPAVETQKSWNPEIQELSDLIEENQELFILFNRMFEEIPDESKFETTPAGLPAPQNYKELLDVLNTAVHSGPTYNPSPQVGCPLNDALAWVMGTPSGEVAFLDSRVNAVLEKLLKEWGEYLTTPDSAAVLNDDPETGWFGKAALEDMSGFEDTYICDPSEPHWGFTSWDDFFTRELKPGARPIAEPENTNVIVNPCESAPFRLSRKVKGEDKFWLKSQPYSLRTMFDRDPRIEPFTGGTVYQAFLSATSYHRWHAPVSGKILKIKQIPGSFYAASPANDFSAGTPAESQAFLSSVAARAYVFIESDNPAIGTIALLFIGMSEVSSCEFTIEEGEAVQKGQEIGMFHFGGSTFCLVLQPDVEAQFFLHGQTPGEDATNIQVKQKLVDVSGG